MTTGSLLTNGWVNTQTDHGVKPTGFGSSATWSGADYPTSIRTYVQVFKRDGTSYPKRVWVDSPKGKKTAEHPYNKAWSYKSDSVVNVGFKQNGALKYDRNVWSAFCTVSPVWSWTSNDQIALLGNLRSRIEGSDFNLAVAMAEMPETLAMIAQSATRLRRGFQHLMNGDLGGCLKWLGLVWKSDRMRRYQWDKTRTVAQLWLELKYGWEPLVKDIFNASRVLEQNLATPLVYSTRVSKAKAGTIRQSVDPARRTVDFANKTCKESVQIIARISEIDTWGLIGLKDPLSVVWEKLYLSYIVDWAVPIGNWLSARGLSQSLTGVFITCHKKEFEVSGPKMVWNQGWIVSMSGGPFTQKEGSFTRTVSNVLDVPLPRIKPLSSIASWGHAANALSLLTGLNQVGRKMNTTDGAQQVYDLALVGTMTMAEARQLQYYDVIP